MFRLGNSAFAEAVFLLALAWPLDVTMMLFLMTLLLLNLIKKKKNFRKTSILSIRISSECGALEWKSVQFGVCIHVSKLRFDQGLADMTFLEDMIMPTS